MSNLNLFLAGSIHQGNERFSDISRGRQCSFMSFSALLYAQTLPIEQWTAASTVDQILAEGDRLYLDALVIRSIPDTETLSLNYLPSGPLQFSWQRPKTLSTPSELPKNMSVYIWNSLF